MFYVPNVLYVTLVIYYHVLYDLVTSFDIHNSDILMK